MMQCVYEDMYGAIKMQSNIFEQLNPTFFIVGSSDDIKYMCANKPEIKHLELLGVTWGETMDKKFNMPCFDWFKIYRCDA